MATEEESIPMDYESEVQHFLSLAKHPKTIALLQSGLVSEITLTSKKQNGVVSDSVNVSMESSHSTITKVTPVTSKISTYGWDQSDKFVKIYISDINGLSELKQENVKSDFSEKSMSVELIGLNRKNYSLVISDLLKRIVPDQSSAKVKSGMVIVSLRKSSSESWDCLTGREKKLKDAREMKPDKNKDEDPGTSMMKLMQKMYDDGDDDMKRTIKKAWHESQEKKNRGEF